MLRRTLLLIGLAMAMALAASRPALADHADDLRAVLARITLPPGFHIALYALAPDARHLAIAPDGKTLIVGSKSDKVYKVAVDLAAPPKVEIFAPKQTFVLPSGPCFAPDGTLFIAEFNRIQSYAPLGGGWDEDHPKTIVAQDKLIPANETSHVHGYRVCRIGPDGLLYVAIGQPHNVPPKEKRPLYDRWGMGGIIRMKIDGAERAVFARGIRNSVGMDFNPADGVLWFTDNQVDWLGDDIPPGEINKAPRAGLDFGFPWYGGGHIRTREYADETPPADAVFPEVEEVAHAADLGMIFYRGQQFPAQWRGIFSAQHGSWNRSAQVGARVIFTPISDGKATGASIPFAEGWNPGKGSYLGRPVDLAELPDGSLIVSDDQEGALYRIFYDGK